MLIIIQARLSSKRLPEKVLKKINGLEIIKHIVKNLEGSKYKFKIVVATSNNKSDKKLLNFLKKNDIIYFCSSLNNVLNRLLKCALFYNAKYFIRINGDSPFIDKRIIEKMAYFLNRNYNKYDLITNVFPRTFPKGQSVEIIKTNCLKKIVRKKLSKYHKEHVTKYLYDNYKLFKIKNMPNIINLNDYNLSVDTKRELNLFKKKLKNVSLNNYIKFEKLIKIIYE